MAPPYKAVPLVKLQNEILTLASKLINMKVPVVIKFGEVIGI